MQMVSGLIHLRLMASASTPDAAQEQHLKARQILCKALKVGPVITAWGPAWWGLPGEQHLKARQILCKARKGS